MMQISERGSRGLSLEERQQTAEAIFPQHGSVTVFDRNQRTEGEHVRDYLSVVRRAPQRLVDMMFSPTSEWILTDTSNVDIFKLRPGELDAYLDGYTQHIGRLVQIALDGQKTYGFNLHDDTHFNFVSTEGQKLLRISPHRGNDVLRRFVIAARGHDLGNVVSRSMHSTVSPLVFKKIFPIVESYPEEWAMIKQAMELHDEKVLSALINTWGPLNAEQLIARFHDFGPEFLALLIADKVHIGPDRVPWPNIEEHLVDEAVNDPHVEVNEYGRTVGITLTPDRKTCTWSLEFKPPRQGRLGGRVSQRMKELYKNGEPYMNAWENLLYDIYHSRITLTILAAFALYPQLQKFEFVIRDSVSGRVTAEPFYRIPPPGELSLDEKIRLMAVQHGYSRKPSQRKGGIRDFF